MKTLLFLFLFFSSTLFADCIVYGWKNGQMICERTSEQKKHLFILSGSILALGTIADVETSLYQIDRGAMELNPVMRPFMNHRWSAYAFRGAVDVGLMMLAWKTNKPWLPMIVGSTYGAIAMWNLRF